MEIFENGTFGKLFEKWNFKKLNLKIRILENLKIGALENYLKIEVKIRLFENLKFWKLFLENNLSKCVSIKDKKRIGMFGVAWQKCPCMSGARGASKSGMADWIDGRLVAVDAPMVDMALLELQNSKFPPNH